MECNNFGLPSSRIKKEIDYSFTLNNNDQWTNFPECRETIKLAEPRLVAIGYNFVLAD